MNITETDRINLRKALRNLIAAAAVIVAIGLLSGADVRAQMQPMRPLPIVSPESLVQTYTGRLAYTLLNRYVTQDSLDAALTDYFLRDSLDKALSGYVKTDDSRLFDSRIPTGAAGGDLTGNYPNPTIKGSIYLPGYPTTNSPAPTDNGNKIATTSYVKNNLASYAKLNSDNILMSHGNEFNFANETCSEIWINYRRGNGVGSGGINQYIFATGSGGYSYAEIKAKNFVFEDGVSAVKSSDARLSDSRTPKGTAGGDLVGTYPNPTIKSSVSLTGNPTVTGNLRLKGSGNYGNKINLGDGDYVYLHEATDDNLTIKAKNIDLAPTTSVTAPTPATTDNSTKIATTAYVNNFAKPKTIKAAGLLYLLTVSSDGTISSRQVGSSSTGVMKTGTGAYTIQTVIGPVAGSVVVTPMGTTPYMVAVAKSGGSVYVRIFTQSGTPVDCGFYFAYYAYANPLEYGL